MPTSRLISGVIVIGLAQLGTIVSCQTAPMDDNGQPIGGAGGSTGGTGGVPSDPTCNGTLGMGGDCDVCQLSLDEYCAERDCVNPDAGIDLCFTGPPRQIIFGCGYVKATTLDGWTDAPPLAVDVWEQDTGQLVYHLEQQSDENACIPVLVVGEEPSCDAWDFSCNSGYVCPIPPHWECLSNCVQGCLPSNFRNCQEWADAAGCGQGGAGGEGGLGGGAP